MGTDGGKVTNVLSNVAKHHDLSARGPQRSGERSGEEAGSLPTAARFFIVWRILSKDGDSDEQHLTIGHSRRFDPLGPLAADRQIGGVQQGRRSGQFEPERLPVEENLFI